MLWDREYIGYECKVYEASEKKTHSRKLHTSNITTSLKIRRCELAIG